MEKLRLLGALCVCVIALVSALTSSNDPLISFLLNAAFIGSCGIIGLWLLQKTNTSKTLKVRQSRHRRSGSHVEFPLTDSHKVSIIKDRRRLSDRRMAQHSFGDRIDIIRKAANH